MADRDECAVCKKMMKQKHKFDLFYKIGFWIAFVFCIVLGVLYFGSGDVFRQTDITNNNNTNVEIENNGDGNNNNVGVGYGYYDIP